MKRSLTDVSIPSTTLTVQMKTRLEKAVEIYYETSVHKKFLADVYAVIPKGRKCVLWFTDKQCWMFPIAKRPYTPGAPGTQRDAVVYETPTMIHMPVMNAAVYAGQGTIVYGTCVSEKRNDVQRRFSVEHVHWLCGQKQPDNGTLERFSAFFSACFTTANGFAAAGFVAAGFAAAGFSNHTFQLCMPIMHANFQDAVRDAVGITTYEVFCIQHRFLHRSRAECKNLHMNLVEIVSHHQQHQQQPQQPQPQPQQQPQTMTFFPKQANVLHVLNRPNVTNVTPRPNANVINSNTRTFIIRPDAQNDIYYVLRSADEPITANTMIAHIPNYKTSVMMNSLFRNIKENRNLDALEESDDEEEEASVPLALVDLNKCVQMSCIFNARFKRWQPVKPQP